MCHAKTSQFFVWTIHLVSEMNAYDLFDGMRYMPIKNIQHAWGIDTAKSLMEKKTNYKIGS